MVNELSQFYYKYNNCSRNTNYLYFITKHISLHSHGVVQLLQMSIFSLSHQIHGADELFDRAAQVSQQLPHAGLLVLVYHV